MINQKNLFVLYLLYIVFISLFSALFAFLFQEKFHIMDQNNNIIIENIPFEFGGLVKNFFNTGDYFQIIHGIKFYLIKLPAIPLLLVFIMKISLNFYFIVICKNVIVFSLYFYFSYLLLKDFKNKILFIIILIIPIIIPYNFSVALNFVYEDNLIAIFLPLLFVSLISESKKKFILSSFILFILYFVKTSMFLLVLIIPLLIIIFEKKINFFNKTLPLITSILAIFLWGYFGHLNTGRFPFGPTGASNNSYVLSSVLNKDFKNYYPDRSTDLIPVLKSKILFNSEWKFYDYYNIKNKNYLKSNYSSYISDIFLKLKFIFFGIHVDGINSDQFQSNSNPIRYSSIFSKFFFNLSIIVSICVLVKNYKRFLNYKKELYFIIILILNLTPHVIAWATSKHLVAISSVSLIYLIFFIKDKYYADNK